MASFKKLGFNKYKFDFRIDGKRIRMTKNCTLQEARTILKGLQSKAVFPNLNNQNNKTLYEECDNFINNYIIKGYRENTIYSYRLAFKYLKECYGDILISNINPEAFYMFLNIKYDNPVSKNTILKHARALFNSIDGPKFALYKVPKKITQHFTDDELDLLYDHMDRKLFNHIWVLDNTGMRLSEMLEHSYLDKDYIKIGSSSKTWAERLVPAYNCHDQYREMKKNPFTRWGVTQRFSKLIKKLGINTDKKTKHLRNTFALRLLLETGDIFYVSRMIGHESVKTTEKYYLPFHKDYLMRVFKGVHFVPKNDEKDHFLGSYPAKFQSERLDSNQRPHDPQSCALESKYREIPARFK
tara:strand:+ start:2281 stop:3345 length:1065 start_codon:yes stop_codon:yes gene_type:complete